MNEHTSNCIKCGKPLEHPTTGRPRAYCSTGCRRAAEKEIGRLNDRLAQLETMAMQARLGRGMPGELVRIGQEIDRAEARLRELLNAAPE